MVFSGHAYLFTGTWREWQPRLQSLTVQFPLPDRRMFQPATQGSWHINEVRDVIRWASFRPYEGSRKLAILEGVEQFTPEAADAFLKTLEEPPVSTLFWLFTPYPGALPATIRSRVTTVPGVGLPPGISPRVRREFLALLRLSLPERLEHSARYSADERRGVEERLHGWLLALRELLLSPPPQRALSQEKILALMARLLRATALVRETNAQPRLLIDSFMISW